MLKINKLIEILIFLNFFSLYIINKIKLFILIYKIL